MIDYWIELSCSYFLRPAASRLERSDESNPARRVTGMKFGGWGESHLNEQTQFRGFWAGNGGWLWKTKPIGPGPRSPARLEARNRKPGTNPDDRNAKQTQFEHGWPRRMRRTKPISAFSVSKTGCRSETKPISAAHNAVGSSRLADNPAQGNCRDVYCG